jgi:hypothetical protein
VAMGFGQHLRVGAKCPTSNKWMHRTNRAGHCCGNAERTA